VREARRERGEHAVTEGIWILLGMRSNVQYCTVRRSYPFFVVEWPEKDTVLRWRTTLYKYFFKRYGYYVGFLSEKFKRLIIGSSS
jgi:hypothetical protein